MFLLIPIKDRVTTLVMRSFSSFARFLPPTRETPDLSSLLTHSRWICGIATVGAIGVSVLSGWGLADEGIFSNRSITGAIIPLIVGILGPHLYAVLKAHVVRLT